jgi:hypothetical protein
MKFSKLVGKAEEIVDRHKQGHPVVCSQMDKLERLLSEKILRYEAKLGETDNPQKREKLQARLKVVNAQLRKSEKLSKSSGC